MQKAKFKILMLVFLGSFVFFGNARAATLYAGSAQENVNEGQTFVVEWYVDTEREPLNLLNLQLKFSAETLDILEMSKGNSILSLWLKEPFTDNTTGVIELIGGAPGGFNHSRAPILRTTFFAKKTGKAQISMNQSSVAFRHDGKGSAAPFRFSPLVFVISPADTLPVKISSPTHPEQAEWSRENRAILKFSHRNGEIYSYSFSQNIDVFPDNTPDQIRDEYIYENLPDGIYYFRLNSQASPQTWQEAGIYRVQIDQTAPEDFEPVIAAHTQTADGKKFVSFSTVDKTSGMSHYEIKAGFLGAWQTASSPYLLSQPIVGNDIRIRAYDLAGNYREAAVSIVPLISNKMLLLISLVILGLAIIVTRQIWRMKHK